MAKLLNMSPLMVILFLGSVAVTILPGNAIPAPAPAPESFKYLQDCAAKLGPCGYEVYLGVFESGSVTKNCCTTLVSTGKLCHVDLVKHLLISQSKYKGHESEILAKSERVWEACVSVSPASSPSL